MDRPGRKAPPLAYVITEPCINTKNAACVEVCPVDVIHPRPDEPEWETATMLYVDPVSCVDCGACEDACPVSAVFADDDVPEQWQHFIQVNADWYSNR